MLVGLLMESRPYKASKEWLDHVKRTFGDYTLVPMTKCGDRGIACRMKVEEESKDYIREFPTVFSEMVAESISPLLEEMPNPQFRLEYSGDVGMWLGRFDL